MTRAPIFEQLDRRKKVADIFRRVLAPHGLESSFDETEIHIKPKVISEYTGTKRLSNALLGHMFPSHAAPCELYHYTSLAAFREIVASRHLWLFALRKRIGQGELDTFAQKHSLKGYLTSSGGEPYFKELSDDIFYTSFADPILSDANMLWAIFGDQGKGVRLKFSLAPDVGDLRPIQYESANRTLLIELNDALTGEGFAPFMPWTISRIGAFYLPSTLEYEGEVRLMLKRYEGGLNDARSHGGYEYWPIPIGSQNSICRIDLTEVAAGSSCDQVQLAQIIQSSQFAALSVI
jgi:hypothetical protein